MTEVAIGVVIVGSGIIGHNHAAAIARVPGLRVVAAWVGRRSRIGRGEGSSGLRYDVPERVG